MNKQKSSTSFPNVPKTVLLRDKSFQPTPDRDFNFPISPETGVLGDPIIISRFTVPTQGVYLTDCQMAMDVTDDINLISFQYGTCKADMSDITMHCNAFTDTRISKDSIYITHLSGCDTYHPTEEYILWYRAVCDNSDNFNLHQSLTSLKLFRV